MKEQLIGVALCLAVGASGAQWLLPTYDQGYAAGKASVVPPPPVLDCSAEQQEAYSLGVYTAVQAAQEYILESCTKLGTVTVDSRVFICLPGQEF